MFRTRLRRALFVWAILSIAAGFALEYGTGDWPLHPTDRFYHLTFGIPVGVAYPWYNSNPGARETYERLTSRAYSPTVQYRKVTMFVEDLSRPDLTAMRKPFQDEVDKEYHRYWMAHANKITWALVYALSLWATVAGGVAMVRWVMRA